LQRLQIEVFDDREIYIFYTYARSLRLKLKSRWQHSTCVPIDFGFNYYMAESRKFVKKDNAAYKL